MLRPKGCHLEYHVLSPDLFLSNYLFLEELTVSFIAQCFNRPLKNTNPSGLPWAQLELHGSAGLAGGPACSRFIPEVCDLLLPEGALVHYARPSTAD